jgi:tetratricopeptide (TPR) repeat protein
VELDDSCFFYLEKRVGMTEKCFEMVGLLTLARVLETSGEHSGSVTSAEIATLPAWDSDRTKKSLECQIRREIKWLVSEGVNIVVTQPGQLTKGPFRLRPFPELNSSDLDQLAKQFAPWTTLPNHTADEIFSWLDLAVPTLESAYKFDTEGTFPTDLMTSTFTTAHNRITVVLGLITKARVLRETGEFTAASNALENAMAALKKERNTQIRTYLVGSVHVQQGWIAYRKEQWGDAKVAVEVALNCVAAHGHLKVRGQAYSLRSLLRRRERRFDEALQDLWQATECFHVTVDLYNLFSIYHNLSCLLSDQAIFEKDDNRRQELLEAAIKYCKASIDHSQMHKIAQNTAISNIQLAVLYIRVRNFHKAMEVADDAYRRAIALPNNREALMAYNLQLILCFTLNNVNGAAKVHRRVVGDFDREADKDQITERFQVLKRQFLLRKKHFSRSNR